MAAMSVLPATVAPLSIVAPTPAPVLADADPADGYDFYDPELDDDGAAMQASRETAQRCADYNRAVALNQQADALLARSRIALAQTKNPRPEHGDG